MFHKFLDIVKIAGVIVLILYIIAAIFFHKEWSLFNNQLVEIFDEIIVKFSHIINWIKQQFK